MQLQVTIATIIRMAAEDGRVRVPDSAGGVYRVLGVSQGGADSALLEHGATPGSDLCNMCFAVG